MTEAQHCRLVTFLGTGRHDEELKQHRYQSTIYIWQETKASRMTEWVMQGLTECLPCPPDDVVVLATGTALKKIGPRLETAKRDPDFPAIQIVNYPEGGDPETLWSQFDCLKENLRASEGTRVVLDITHGFRSQPFFAAAVLAFIRGLDRPRREVQVVYGAHEARDNVKNTTPVWDLTPFIDLLDWTRELTLFLRTGRSRGVEELMESAIGFEDLAASIGRFGADLETIRTGALLLGRDSEPASAHALHQQLKTVERTVAHRFPPFHDVLEVVRQMVAPLVIKPQPLNTREAHAALANLARLYFSIGRYVEAATTAQEGWVSLYATDVAATPGDPGCTSDSRKDAADLWRKSEKKYPHKASQIRNDINHAGYGDNPATHEKIIKDVTSLVRDFCNATLKKTDKMRWRRCF
ncbi:MAG: CRISPR-associated DxTHG motif protein [Rhodospirillales bacterium]|nr:MAG: CRISPR-associated DxTHG motif protein [Rhodospirillales bacterium]